MRWLDLYTGAKPDQRRGISDMPRERIRPRSSILNRNDPVRGLVRQCPVKIGGIFAYLCEQRTLSSNLRDDLGITGSLTYVIFISYYIANKICQSFKGNTHRGIKKNINSGYCEFMSYDQFKAVDPRLIRIS